MKAIVAPRPIAWVGSVSAKGVHNLAPYSFFNLISARPPLLMISSEGSKDSVTNIDATGEFTVNLVTQQNMAKMNHSSASVAPEVDEYALADVDWLASDLVQARRVADTPVSMECKLIEIKHLEDIDGQQLNTSMIIAQIVRVHVNEAFIKDGLFDLVAAQVVARAGYRGDYVPVERTLEMLRPRD
jgi:flavin reductase (DIM6/NTAB) family NADH-FMN oxidoreductase RutF